MIHFSETDTRFSIMKQLALQIQLGGRGGGL